MPTSPFGHIECFVRFLAMANPSSLLDVGLGNGKLGFIARDVLDVMLGQRYRRENWKVRIDGIEIFADYIQDHQRAIYNDIHVGDAFEVIDRLGTYDAIILGDVLEHFEKPKAIAFLDKCVCHADKSLILGVPLTDGWKQPAIYGNPYETHRSVWNCEELKPLACAWELFSYSAGPYGAFLIKKEDYLKHRPLGHGSTCQPNCRSVGKSLREKYSLTKENISRLNLLKFSRYVANQIHRNYFFDTNFREHYQLIAYLSTLFQNSTLIDVGTNLGYSALALSFNGRNRVTSYDIVDCKELNFQEELDQIEYRIGDVLNDPRIFSSPLIMLDTNHDGIFEDRFYRHLRANNYQGLLFLDDIHLNQAMRDFWQSIVEPKEDITDLGHWSGSGLVDFSRSGDHRQPAKQSRQPQFMTSSVPQSAKGSGLFSETLHLGLVTGQNYGWGICSQYLMRELSKLLPCRVLREEDGSARNPRLNGKLFQALTSVDFFAMFEQARAERNFGYTFFENELTDHSVENAKKYDLVLAGSTWCRDRMLEKGITNCDVLLQGIDPEVFYPIEEEKEQESFVIFSGGKFELRKGQDLVLKAVKILQEKYSDIVLATCWYNIWPESMKLMAYSPHIRFEYLDTSWPEFMAHICRINGIDLRRVKIYGLVPNAEQRQLYGTTDIGVFPNRCEGGTNLVLMEYMACGKPVIVSHASGHKDIVNRNNALLLSHLRDINLVDANNRQVGRWQEPAVDELVSTIEYAYHHRDDIKKFGRRAAEDLRHFTWERTARHLIRLMK